MNVFRLLSLSIYLSIDFIYLLIGYIYRLQEKRSGEKHRAVPAKK